MTQPPRQPVDELIADIAAREKRASKRTMLLTVIPVAVAIILVTVTARSVTKAQRELQQIEIQRAVLEQQRDNLREQVSALEEQRSRLRQAVTLLVPPQSADARPAMVTASATGTRQAVNNFAANSRYAVGFYSLAADQGQYDSVRDGLQKLGYVVTQGSNLDRRPPWLSRTSAVMYYADTSEQKAQEMTRELKQLTGSSFEIKRGSGLGVIEGQERWTFFVHWIPNDRRRPSR